MGFTTPRKEAISASLVKEELGYEGDLTNPMSWDRRISDLTDLLAQVQRPVSFLQVTLGCREREFSRIPTIQQNSAQVGQRGAV